MIKMSRIYHDIARNSRVVTFYDHKLVQIESRPAKVFKGSAQTVSGSQGSHKRHMKGSDWLVFNPQITDSLTPVNGYDWYATRCASLPESKKDGSSIEIDESRKMTVNTQWKPIALTVIPQDITHLEDPTAIYIVASKKVPGFVTASEATIIVPLLDTIINLHPKYTGFQLDQLACEEEGEFVDEMSNGKSLIQVLFNRFKDEFATLCLEECCPLQHLYICDFNHTFNHNQEREPYEKRPEAMTRFEKVFMVPTSQLIGPKTYGNIPWIIKDENERPKYHEGHLRIVGPFVFFKIDSNGKGPNCGNMIRLDDIVIFPELWIDDKRYPAGSMICLCPIKDSEAQRVVFRGELFESMTSKERMILDRMFRRFNENKLQERTDCSAPYRDFPFEPHQMKVRGDYLKIIQHCLLDVKRVAL